MPGKTKGSSIKQIGETERAMLGARKALEPLREEIARLTKKQMQIEAQQQASGASDRTISAILGMDGVFGTVSSPWKSDRFRIHRGVKHSGRGGGSTTLSSTPIRPLQM